MLVHGRLALTPSGLLRSRNSFFFLLHLQLNSASWPIPEHGLSGSCMTVPIILLTLSVFSLETALCVVRLMGTGCANLVALQHLWHLQDASLVLLVLGFHTFSVSCLSVSLEAYHFKLF